MISINCLQGKAVLTMSQRLPTNETSLAHDSSNLIL